VAPEGVQIAYKIATGEEMPEEVVLEGKKVDATNIDEMLGKGF
jgi:ribose transport system substrate-binding protein